MAHVHAQRITGKLSPYADTSSSPQQPSHITHKHNSYICDKIFCEDFTVSIQILMNSHSLVPQLKTPASDPAPLRLWPLLPG